MVEYVGVASTQILLENTTAAVDEDTSTSPVTANQLESPLPSKSGRPLPLKSLSTLRELSFKAIVLNFKDDTSFLFSAKLELTFRGSSFI